MLVMTLMMMINCDSSVMMILLTALFISINPVHSQRSVHLYNYVVEAGTGVNFLPPVRPVPQDLRWSSYSIDAALVAENFSSTSADAQTWRFDEICQKRMKRPCNSIFSLNSRRKSLSMSQVALDQADILRVYQGKDGGFSNKYIQRRYRPANETAHYHKGHADFDYDDYATIDIVETSDNSSTVNYAIYLSVYEGHECSFASKPNIIDYGDTLRLRCQITMNGFWTPSLYFRNEYDGSIYDGNTTDCSSPVRPFRYCIQVEVQVTVTQLAFACHVRFPSEGRTVPTIPSYADAQWPHHNHHSPVCYLQRLYVDTIPSDVNFVCDEMPCEETISVGQEIFCQAEAYPPPLVKLSVIIAEPHRDHEHNQDDDDEYHEEEPNLVNKHEHGGEEHNFLEEEKEEHTLEPVKEEADEVEEHLFLDANDDGGNVTSNDTSTASDEPQTLGGGGEEGDMGTSSLQSPEVEETERGTEEGSREETTEGMATTEVVVDISSSKGEEEEVGVTTEGGSLGTEDDLGVTTEGGLMSKEDDLGVTTEGGLMSKEEDLGVTTEGGPMGTEEDLGVTTEGGLMSKEDDLGVTTEGGPMGTEDDLGVTTEGGPMGTEDDLGVTTEGGPMGTEDDLGVTTEGGPMGTEDDLGVTKEGGPMGTDDDLGVTTEGGPMGTEDDLGVTTEGGPMGTEDDLGATTEGGPMGTEDDLGATTEGGPMGTEDDLGETTEGGAKGEEEEVLVVTGEAYKVTPELAGKVLEVSCNISNSMGWGTGTMVIQVRADDSSSSLSVSSFEEDLSTVDETTDSDYETEPSRVDDVTTVRHIDESTDDSANETTDESRDDSTSDWTDESRDDSTSDWKDESRDDSTSDWRDDSTSDWRDESRDDSTSDWTDDSIDVSKDDTTDDTTNDWTDETSDELVEESGEGSADDGSALLSTAEYDFDRGGDGSWKRTVAPEPGVFQSVKEKIDDGKRVERPTTTEGGDDVDASGESSDVELTRPTEKGHIANAPLLPDEQTTLLELINLPTADPADIELQMELARKFGPREIRLYCNGALCIGEPKMLVGDRVKCDAKGTPPPKITLHVGRDLDIDGPEYEFIEKDRGSLTVVCIAKNLYGSMTSRIVITVSAKRAQVVEGHQKGDDSKAGRPTAQSVIVGLSVLLSVAAAHIRLLSQQLQH